MEKVYIESNYKDGDQYCSQCGSPLREEIISKNYDGQTGVLVKIHVIKRCSRNFFGFSISCDNVPRDRG